MYEVLYIGPSIAYHFLEKWSTTLVALATPKTYRLEAGTDMIKLRQYDVDLALNYQINRSMKVFGGAKYLAFAYNNKTNDGEGIHHATGPGGGVSVTLPAGYNIYVLTNVSAIHPGKPKRRYSNR